MTSSIPVEEIKKEFIEIKNLFNQPASFSATTSSKMHSPGRTTRSSTPRAQSFWPKESM